MASILRQIASLFYAISVLGGLIACYVVFNSMIRMGIGGGPDFSAVIAVTFTVIPYCIARSIDGIRINDYSDHRRPEPQQPLTCRCCAKPISHGVDRCPHCNVKLN